MKIKKYAKELAAAAAITALIACAALQVPTAGLAVCHSVPVASGVAATANHCPGGIVIRRDEATDLKLMREPTSRVWQMARPSPGPATIVGREYQLLSITHQDGHEFLSLWPDVEPGESGAAVVQNGKLVGIVIGVDNNGEGIEYTRTWATSSKEVERLLGR
jgi:hypothetical protein